MNTYIRTERKNAQFKLKQSGAPIVNLSVNKTENNSTLEPNSRKVSFLT